MNRENNENLLAIGGTNLVNSGISVAINDVFTSNKWCFGPRIDKKCQSNRVEFRDLSNKYGDTKGFIHIYIYSQQYDESVSEDGGLMFVSTQIGISAVSHQI